MMLAPLKTAASIGLCCGLLTALGGSVAALDPGPATAKPAPETSGDPLPPHALARLGTTRLRERDYVEYLHFTPDGSGLIAGGRYGVSTWDTATGKRIQILPKEAEAADPRGIALAPDGKLLVTPGHTFFQIWETATAKRLRTIAIDTGQSFRGGNLHTCFSPDGTMLASQSGDQLNHVALWDPATGRLLRSWDTGERRIAFLAFTADGKTLITASDDNAIRAWEVVTGKLRRHILTSPNPISTLALSPDGKHMAVMGYDSKTTGQMTMYLPQRHFGLWDVATKKQVRRFDDPARAAADDFHTGFRVVAFAPDGRSLLAGAGDGSVYVCPVAGRQGPRRIWRGPEGIGAIAVAPDGHTAAVATHATIHLIDPATGKEVFADTAHPGTAYKTAVTPDGRTAVIGSGSNLYLWDIESGRLRKRLQGHHGYINGIQLIDGGRKAVTSAYSDGALRVWDLLAEKEVRRIESADKANILQAVSPDGKTLAVGGSNSVLMLYDADTGKEIRRLKGHGDANVYGAAFLPDGRTLVVWYSADNMVYHWDLTTGTKIKEYAFIDGDPPQPNPQRGRPVYEVAVSPDGRWIAFGSQSRFLEVRNLVTGEVVYRRTQLRDGVCPLTFSPDSRMLAWSGWWNDPTVHVVEVATGHDRCRFAGHTGRVLSLSFSQDGTKLVSGSADTTALVWDLTDRHQVKRKK